MMKLLDLIKRFSLYLAWTLSLIGSLITIYYSDVWLLEPCVLCWYQRCCLYPLVFILAGAVYNGATWVTYYLLPLTTLGSLFALTQIIEQSTNWHLLQKLCRIGTSCAKSQIAYFGWLTIPMMSLILFIALSLLLIVAHEDRLTTRD